VQLCGLALLGHALPGLWPVASRWSDRVVAACLRAACVADFELGLTAQHRQRGGGAGGLPLNALRALPPGAALLGEAGCRAVRRLALRVGGLALALGGAPAACALALAQTHGGERVKRLAAEMGTAQAEWHAALSQ
jgi:hypothetical protein